MIIEIIQRIQEKFDVAIIGGGPAGIMVAGRAAELGAKIVGALNALREKIRAKSNRIYSKIYAQ